MAIGTFPGMLQEGDHASRPAATAVGSGALYACSDHALIYQSDGATWSTWATLGGGAPAAHAASHESGGSDEIDVTGLTGAGGGGGGWDNPISESGASFANFTSESGTWASNGTLIQQTASGATHRRTHHNTLVPIGAGVVVEVDIRFVTVGGGDNAAGILIGTPGANGVNGLAVVLESTADTAQVERSGTAALDTMPITLVVSTWYTLRAAVNGGYCSVWVDGVLLGSSFFDAMAGSADFVGLITYDAIADFRNFDVWTMALP